MKNEKIMELLGANKLPKVQAERIDEVLDESINDYSNRGNDKKVCKDHSENLFNLLKLLGATKLKKDIQQDLIEKLHEIIKIEAGKKGNVISKDLFKWFSTDEKINEGSFTENKSKQADVMKKDLFAWPTSNEIVHEINLSESKRKDPKVMKKDQYLWGNDEATI